MFVHREPPTQPTSTRKIVHGQCWYEKECGDVYPSVSTMLACIKNPGVAAWKKAKINKKIKTEQERNDAVQDMIAKYLNNDPEHADAYTRDYVRLFNRVKTRLKAIDNIHCFNVPLISDMLKLAGDTNCIAEYNGVLSVIDFRTSSQYNTDNDIEECLMECTAYAIMYSEMYNQYVDDVVIFVTPEQTNKFPMVHKKKIDEYVAPLLERIQQFRDLNNGK